MRARIDRISFVGTATVYHSFRFVVISIRPVHDYNIDVATQTYNAILRQDGRWWIGWIEEVPGVNSQGETREELLDNLREALGEALEMNREDARRAAGQEYEEVAIQR